MATTTPPRPPDAARTPERHDRLRAAAPVLAAAAVLLGALLGGTLLAGELFQVGVLLITGR